MIRILVVEDSVTQREILTRMVQAETDFSVVGEARNGREAVDRVHEHDPDVVLMDLHMPDMDGIEATRAIMRQRPLPIVVISGSLQRQDVDLGMQALDAGAVSVIAKPDGAALLHLTSMAPELRQTLEAAASARLKARPRDETGTKGAAVAEAGPVTDTAISVIGICASTGGPPVLREILSQVPRPFPIPILLVQHISRGFEDGFARWLGTSSGQATRVAHDRERPGPGVWIAPSEKHLTLASSGRVALVERSSGERHCPSGHRLFESLARNVRERAAGIVLTGMGDDGAQGLLALKQSGGLTIIQDEASALIWGMPQRAKDLQANREELSPRGIADALTRIARQASKG